MPKQKDGRYRAKVTVGKDIKGDPIIKYVSGRTKKELEERKVEIRQKYIDGLQNVKTDVMFNQYALDWYETYKRPTIGPSSQRVYKTALNKHILPYFDDRQLRSIGPAELQQLLNAMSGMSKTSVGYVHIVLTNIFKRAYAERVISYDPTVALTVVGNPAEKRRALTPAEELAMHKVAETHPEGLLLHMLYYTGMRRGEALGLKWSDIDFVKKEIHVSRDIDFVTASEGELKNETSARSIPIPDAFLPALNKARGIGDAYVFQGPETGTYLCERTYRRIWERLQAAMLEASNGAIESKELPSSKQRRKKNEERNKLLIAKGKEVKPFAPIYGSMLTPHYFRHNYATHCHANGVDVMYAHRWLGHKDIKTTMAIYTHLSEQNKPTETTKLNEAFQKKVAGKLPE